MSHEERPSAPGLTWFATAHVEIGPPVEIGDTGDGVRRIIPITGGTVRADGWSGRVLDLGADFQRHPREDLALLTALYALEADDGTRILVENEALRTGAVQDVRALLAGERVPAERIYFRCAPRLSAPLDSAYGWVNSRLFIGVGMREPDSVRIDFFSVD